MFFSINDLEMGVNNEMTVCVANNIKLMVRGIKVSCEEWLKSQRLVKSVEHTIQTRSRL